MKSIRSLRLAPGKAAVLQKELVARVTSHVLPVYLVAEYPKSGGTWLKFMLAEAIGVPAWTKGNPVRGSNVMQAHWIKPKGGCRSVALFRDGRDVMVSYYFHSFFRNEFRNQSLVAFMRNHFKFTDFEDIQSNLPRFIEEMATRPISPVFSWGEFVRAWYDRPGVVACRYEDLRKDPSKTLQRLIDELSITPLGTERACQIADRYTMEKMKAQKDSLDPGNRNRGLVEKSFTRKGIVGGWTEYFTEDALQVFEYFFAEEMKILDYPLGRPQT
ncbi:sulfotransferase domain-containing protein [Paracoccaceae bacterium]|nr:sulfotransferase domain-containing protein [Paracoccaceae bacterium]